MKTLANYFSQQKSELKSKLEKADTGKHIARIIDDYLRELSQVDGEYIAGLTINQAKLANEMIRAIRAGFNSVSATPDLSILTDNPSPNQSANPSGPSFSGVIPSSIGGIAGTLAGRALSSTPLALALGLGVGAFIGIGAGFLDTASDSPEVPPQSNTDKRLTFDFDQLLNRLQEVLETIDQTIEAQSKPVEEEKSSQPSLDEFKDILAFFQDQLGELNVDEDDFDTSVRRRISQVSNILRKYGVEVKEPEASYGDEGQIYALFDPEPSLDPDAEPRALIRPALIKEDKILFRGAVVASDDDSMTEV